jgi:hypothetical protein
VPTNENFRATPIFVPVFALRSVGIGTNDSPHRNYERKFRAEVEQNPSVITVRKLAEAALRRQAQALRASNGELDQFNRAMVGRELRMSELKQGINELCHRLGEPPRHATDPFPSDRVPFASPTTPPSGGGV